MKTLFAIGSLASALLLGWHLHELTAEKKAAESRSRELSSEIDAAKMEIQEANVRIAQLAVPAQVKPSADAAAPAPQPTPVPNWVEEKNCNWKSSLARGSYDNHRDVTISTPPTYVVTQPASPTIVVPRPPMPPPSVRPPSMSRPPLVAPAPSGMRPPPTQPPPPGPRPGGPPPPAGGG